MQINFEKRVKMYHRLIENLDVQPNFKHHYGYIVNSLVEAKILQDKYKYAEEDKSSDLHQHYQPHHTVPGTLVLNANANIISSNQPSFTSEH